MIFQNCDLQGNLQTALPIGSQVRHEWKGTLPGVDGGNMGLIIRLMGSACMDRLEQMRPVLWDTAQQRGRQEPGTEPQKSEVVKML